MKAVLLAVLCALLHSHLSLTLATLTRVIVCGRFATSGSHRWKRNYNLVRHNHRCPLRYFLELSLSLSLSLLLSPSLCFYPYFFPRQCFLTSYYFLIFFQLFFFVNQEGCARNHERGTRACTKPAFLFALSGWNNNKPTLSLFIFLLCRRWEEREREKKSKRATRTLLAFRFQLCKTRISYLLSLNSLPCRSLFYTDFIFSVCFIFIDCTM